MGSGGRIRGWDPGMGSEPPGVGSWDGNAFHPWARRGRIRWKSESGGKWNPVGIRGWDPGGIRMGSRIRVGCLNPGGGGWSHPRIPTPVARIQPPDPGEIRGGIRGWDPDLDRGSGDRIRGWDPGVGSGGGI